MLVDISDGGGMIDCLAPASDFVDVDGQLDQAAENQRLETLVNVVAARNIDNCLAPGVKLVITDEGRASLLATPNPDGGMLFKDEDIHTLRVDGQGCLHFLDLTESGYRVEGTNVVVEVGEFDVKVPMWNIVYVRSLVGIESWTNPGRVDRLPRQ